MWRVIPLLGATSLLLGSATYAQSLDTETIAKVAATTRSLCLSGSQYDLQVNADGSLSLLKLEPGGQGKIRITQSTGTGGALDYQDEGKRVEADKNIIGCVSQNLPVLLAAAGARLAPPAQQLSPQQQPLNPQPVQLISDTAASICNTVKDAKGQKSDVQLQGDVKAQLSGLIGKVVGASGKGSLTGEEFEGLSRDATATALEGDRGCRERVFNTMFKMFSPPPPPTTPPIQVQNVPGIPLAIAARLIKANANAAQVNLLMHNTRSPFSPNTIDLDNSPYDIEFSFGPTKPQLMIWGTGEVEASSNSPGVCSDDDSCFSNTPVGKSLDRYFTLQAGTTLSSNVDFSFNSVTLTDPSVLTVPDKAIIRLSIRTAYGTRSYVELAIAPH